MWFNCSYGTSNEFLKESGRLVSIMSTVWEDTDDCANKYRCALAIYLITVLSY